MFPHRQGIEVYYRIIFANYKFGASSYVQRLLQVEETHRAAKFRTQQVYALPSSSRGKSRSFWSRHLEVTVGVSLWRQKVRLFLGRNRFRFLSEASRETVTFCIYLFYLLCYCLFYFFLTSTYAPSSSYGTIYYLCCSSTRMFLAVNDARNVIWY